MAHKDVAIPVVFPDYKIAVNTPTVTITAPNALPFVDVLAARLKVPATQDKDRELGHAGILFLKERPACRAITSAAGTAPQRRAR